MGILTYGYPKAKPSNKNFKVIHNSKICNERLRDFYYYIFHYDFQINQNIKKIKSLYFISLSISTTFVK